MPKDRNSISERAKSRHREGETHPYCRLNDLQRHCWKKYASQEDYFKLLEELSRLYANASYNRFSPKADGKIPSQNAMFVDYKEWLDKNF